MFLLGRSNGPGSADWLRPKAVLSSTLVAEWFGILFYVIDMIPFGDPPFKWAIKAILAIVLVLILLDATVGGGRLGLPSWRAP